MKVEMSGFNWEGWAMVSLFTFWLVMGFLGIWKTYELIVG